MVVYHRRTRRPWSGLTKEGCWIGRPRLSRPGACYTDLANPVLSLIRRVFDLLNSTTTVEIMTFANSHLQTPAGSQPTNRIGCIGTDTGESNRIHVTHHKLWTICRCLVFLSTRGPQDKREFIFSWSSNYSSLSRQLTVIDFSILLCIHAATDAPGRKSVGRIAATYSIIDQMYEQHTDWSL